MNPDADSRGWRHPCHLPRRITQPSSSSSLPPASLAMSDPSTFEPLDGPTAGQWLLYRNVQRFRGRLVSKAHRLLHHSALSLRIIKKKKKKKKKKVQWLPAAQMSTMLVLNLSLSHLNSADYEGAPPLLKFHRQISRGGQHSPVKWRGGGLLW